MTVMDRFNDPANKNIMEAKELRIGNFVNYTHVDSEGSLSSIVCVNQISDDWVLDETQSTLMMSELKPIPLTEEWLKKCGFDNSEYKKGYIGIDVRYTDFVLAYPKTHIEHSEFFCWTFEQGKLQMFKEIKYVHQLQNLYFALTGEELTIKEL